MAKHSLAHSLYHTAAAWVQAHVAATAHGHTTCVGLLLGALPTLLALNIGGTKIGNDELAELSGEHPHCYLYRR